MANMESGKWVILYAIYILAVSLLAYGYVNAELGDLEQDNGFTFQQEELIELNGGICDHYKSSSLLNYGVRNTFNGQEIGTRDTSCNKLPIDSADVCNTIEGCSWENTTSFFIFWSADVPEYCGGNINVTYYDSAYETIGSLANNDICKMNETLLSTSPQFCENIGCNYIDREEDVVSFNYIWETIAFLFGFNMTIPNLPTIINILFTIIFIFLPSFALILAIFRHLPFVN